MNKIDWSKAPEGATHYSHNKTWYKFADDEYLFFSGVGNWIGSGNSTHWHKHSLTPRPTETTQQEWVNGLPPMGEKCLLSHVLVTSAPEPVVLIDFIKNGFVVYTVVDTGEMNSVDTNGYTPFKPLDTRTDEQKAIDNLIEAMNSRCDLPLRHDDHLQNGDTQLGVEFAFEWMLKNGFEFTGDNNG